MSYDSEIQVDNIFDGEFGIIAYCNTSLRNLWLSMSSPVLIPRCPIHH